MEAGMQEANQRHLEGGEILPNTLPEGGQGDFRTCTATPKALDLQKTSNKINKNETEKLLAEAELRHCQTVLEL